MKPFSLLNAKLAGSALMLALARAVCAQDFTLTLQPSALTLIPNEGASFVVSMTPLNGFTSQVELAVGALPSGVTAQFSPPELTLPGTSILTLTAATNATLGSFTLNLSASGGGITNTTSSSVTVNFGLLPICTGAFAGQVTDAQTGLPVTNAVVSTPFSGIFARAGTNGTYTLTNVPLGNNNAPYLCYLQATAPGYWYSVEVAGYAVCDATNTVNLQMVLKQYGSISGRVSIQGGGPAVGAPVTQSLEASNGGESYSLTDSNGYYQITGITVGYTNSPAVDVVQCWLQPAFWRSQTNGLVQANSNTVVNLIIVPVCHGTVTGSVFYADTRSPATNASVSIYDALGANYVRTDANGNYSLTNIALDENGTLTATVSASAPGYNSAATNVSVADCGATASVPPLYLPAIPHTTYYYGSASGHIYDLQTGLPIAQATAQIYSILGNSYIVYADTNGAFLCTNILVGTGAATNAGYSVSASAAGYFENSSNIVVYAGLTTTQDVYLLRIGYGGVMGTVRDSATTLPLAGVTISVRSAGSSYPVNVQTDVNGHYFSGPLPLGSPTNGPTATTISADRPGYYEVDKNTTITLGATNVVNLDLLRVCTGATIIGSVVNALTQQPITNATLSVTGSPYYFHTDTNGGFILTNITVGNDNSPIQVTVAASAPGFISQYKTVTIFCSATITTEFGAPQTAFSSIQGVVTNVVTGRPLAGVFIGSQFGEATLTDTNGLYQLTQAPLGANNSSRTWNITAIPTDFPAQTLPVTVSSNAVSTLNFGFGEPPTALIVNATGAPDPVTVGGELVYVVTLTNTVADARQVQLSDTLPPGVTLLSAAITNSPGTAFSAPVYSNNVVTTTAADFGSASAVALAITVTPTVAGMLTNVATVSSTTTDLDPTGSNHTATVVSRALAPAVPTALIVTVQATPPATVLVGSNLLYTVTLTNTIANAADVQLVDTLPPSVEFVSASLSMSPGGHFSQPVFSNGAVTTSAGSFGSNSAVVLFITVTPSAAGTLTNVANVTTSTTNLAAGTTLSASVTNTAVPPGVTALYADVGLWMNGAPNPVLVSNQITYTLVVTNTGPSDAPIVTLDDTLPVSASFRSAVTSQGSTTQSGAGLHWDLGALANGASATATVIVVPAIAGLITNSATVALANSVGTLVMDTNLANNSTTVITTVNAPAVTNLSVQVLGPIVFNRQTGLFEQPIRFNNLSATPITGVRISLGGLPSDLVLYNASGSSNGVPFVEYDQIVSAGGSVGFVLEYYRPNRLNFVSTNFTAVAVLATTPAAPSGTTLQLDRGPFLSEGELVIEFASRPGATYCVEYSADMQIWKTAVPPIVAAGTRVQWADTGPPKTDSRPGPPGQRFYRIVQLP
jgi:uncharacterized repeat protein (TIGR01451 family)